MRPPFTGVARRARPPWASRERRESTHHGRTGCGRESARDAQGCSGWRRGAQPERRAPWSSAKEGIRGRVSLETRLVFFTLLGSGVAKELFASAREK